jgi:hypothetical protein
MNADTRFAASLLLSLALSMPNLLKVLSGDAEIVLVGIYFLVAFIFLFIAVGTVGHLYNTYCQLTTLQPEPKSQPADTPSSRQSRTDSTADYDDQVPPHRRAGDLTDDPN